MNEPADSSDALTAYMREIGAYPLLTAEQEVSLARQMEAGTRASRRLAKVRLPGKPEPELEAENRVLEEQVRDGLAARQQLVEANLRLVVSLARRYRGHGLCLQDLIQEGNIGLQNGIQRFDWRKGYRLSTYVYWWIRQAMTRALANDSRTIRLPVHVGEMLRSASRAERGIEDELQRPATLAEVAKRVGVAPERLRHVRLISAEPASLEKPLLQDRSLTRGDVIVDEQAADAIDACASQNELHDTLMAVIGRLPEREREVLVLRYGLDGCGPRTLGNVGEQMGFSGERARQLERQAFRRLRTNVNLRRVLAEEAA
jgi:RNA polymerase sigma factor (sigma-70 family)